MSKPSATLSDKNQPLRRGYPTINGTIRKIKKGYITKNGIWQRCYSGALKFKYYKPGSTEEYPNDGSAYSFEGNPEENWTLRLWKSGVLKFESVPGDVEVWMNGAGGGSNTRNHTAGGGGYIVNQTLQNLSENIDYPVHIGQGVMEEDGEDTTAFGLTANGGKSAAHGSGGASGGGGEGGYNTGGSSGAGGSDGGDGAGRGSGRGMGVSTKEFGVGEPLSAGGGGVYHTNDVINNTKPYVSCPGGNLGGGGGASGGNSDYGQFGSYGGDGAANTGSGGGNHHTKGGSGRVSLRHIE